MNRNMNRLLEALSARLVEGADELPAWAEKAGFKEKMGSFKLFVAPRGEYLYYLTPNKGGFRLKVDGDKLLQLPPEDAKEGPGFKTSGSVPFQPAMGMGPNRRLYNLAVKITPNKDKAGSFDARFQMRPSDAVGNSIFLASMTATKAEQVIAAMDKRGGSEAAAADYLSQRVGRRAEFIQK